MQAQLQIASVEQWVQSRYRDGKHQQRCRCPWLKLPAAGGQFRGATSLQQVASDPAARSGGDHFTGFPQEGGQGQKGRSGLPRSSGLGQGCAALKQLQFDGAFTQRGCQNREP